MMLIQAPGSLVVAEGLCEPLKHGENAHSKWDRPTVSLYSAIYSFSTTSWQTSVFTILRTQTKVFSKKD